MNPTFEGRCCALVLAGGTGTRFWPLSRRERPKQLLGLMGEGSLLRQTVERLGSFVDAEDVFCSTTDGLAVAIADDLGIDPASGRVLAEPVGRNTLPAIAWSVDRIRALHPHEDPVVVVLPSDHYVTRPEDFREALAVAVEEAASRDRIVTLGVPPRWAETGYGYLELASAVDGLGVYDVRRFTEKPELRRAEEFVAGGRHLWNAGIFVFRASVFAARLEAHQPEIGRRVAELREAASERVGSVYAAMPDVSIDFGLMEALDDTAAVPLDCGWNDLGSWDALAEVLDADGRGNRCRGDVVCVDADDNLLVADEGTVAVVGVEGLVVVRTGDAVLVVPRGRAQEVREVVEALRDGGRKDRL